MNMSPLFASLLLRLPLPTKLVNGLNPPPPSSKVKHENHVIIIGFGPSGQNLARSLKESSLPYVIVEMNPETVIAQKAKGEPILYGDATHPAILAHLDLDTAKAVAVLINDFSATQRIVETIRRLNQNTFIFARTRYMQQVKALYSSGADDVIPDEFGTSVEVFTRVLRTFSIAPDQIDKIAQKFRCEGDELHRLLYKEKPNLSEANT
jgi:CPA2 family monovalent cation:H+ antiporter-2